MLYRQTRTGSFLSKTACSFAFLSILTSAGGLGVRAQTAEALSQVTKVYVESFGQENGAAELRSAVIKRLRSDRKLEVVTVLSEADAVIKGGGTFWVTGYVSSDPRAPSNARQPIFHGFLSAEVVGKDNEPLWSYLVTPSKFRAGAITQDLANHLVTKLDLALAEKSEKVAVAPFAERTGETSLAAAGATFPAPLYQKWFESFQQGHPKTHIAYSAVGSDAGVRLLTDGKVDFAASDMPLSDERQSQSRTTFLHFPSVLGAVVPIYRVKGPDENLNFTPETLAGIYLGKIRKWNDPKIRESNRNAALPDSEIIVIHRSDGSGTTFVWTDYLSKVSPDWKAAVGVSSVVQWPVGTGVEGNDGVAAMVQQTPNSIGYVELVYSLRHQLSFGAVRNSAGQFIQADLASVTAAAREAAGAVTSDFQVSITNASGKDAYPIATFTWWLLPRELGGSPKKPAMLELLQWVLTSGQKQCSALGYAPLPREIANRELEFLKALE
jgi:phosphate transport system substrate-binding protein